MTILVTGGRGKTGSTLSKALHAANIPFIIASRTGKADPYRAVTFDWQDPATHENPFKADPSIDRVYIVSPDGVADPLPVVKPFIDLARSKGVKRFVLLSASQLEAGSPAFMGGIHQYLIDIGVEYAVLRPTWFQQNFGTMFAGGIRDGDQFFSAMGDGRLPFVSTEDIAEIALKALTVEPSFNKDILVFGPELYSHDEVAKLLSTVLGREIAHKRITVDELQKFFAGVGWSDAYAAGYANMENNAANGLEEQLFNAPADKKFIGKHRLEDYIKANRELWVKQ